MISSYVWENCHSNCKIYLNETEIKFQKSRIFSSFQYLNNIINEINFTEQKEL